MMDFARLLSAGTVVAFLAGCASNGPAISSAESARAPLRGDASGHWPELRDRIDTQLLPHAAFARHILRKCPQQVKLIPETRSDYRRVLAKFDAYRRVNSTAWQRFEQMAVERSKMHSCSEFADMVREFSRSPNFFLQAR